MSDVLPIGFLIFISLVCLWLDFSRGNWPFEYRWLRKKTLEARVAALESNAVATDDSRNSAVNERTAHLGSVLAWVLAAGDIPGAKESGRHGGYIEMVEKMRETLRRTNRECARLKVERDDAVRICDGDTERIYSAMMDARRERMAHFGSAFAAIGHQAASECRALAKKEEIDRFAIAEITARLENMRFDRDTARAREGAMTKVVDVTRRMVVDRYSNGDPDRSVLRREACEALERLDKITIETDPRSER